jgi:hypothetical protein
MYHDYKTYSFKIQVKLKLHIIRIKNVYIYFFKNNIVLIKKINTLMTEFF